MVTLATPTRIPSLEPAMQASIDAITALFDDAATEVAALSPETDPAITLTAPVAYRLTNAGYELPVDWPTVIVGGSNLRRLPSQTNNAPGGEWRGVLEFHCWLQDDEPDRLTRSLLRYAATIWLCLLSADHQQQLGRARLCPETFAVARGPDAGQSLGVQSIVVVVEVGLRA